MLTGSTPSMTGYRDTVREFSENGNDIFLQNQLAEAGMAMATNATPDEQSNPEISRQKAQLNFITNTFMARAIGQTAQQRLANSNLSNVTVRDGVMQIEGEDGQQRNATLEEKIILEDNSKANSMHLTQDEIDMNKYLNDPAATDIPEALQDIAKEKGLDPSQVSREEYNSLIEDKMPGQAPRITASGDITAPITIDSINELGEASSSISANPAGIAVANIKEQFGITAKGASPESPQPSGPQMPEIQQQANFTPAGP